MPRLPFILCRCSRDTAASANGRLFALSVSTRFHVAGQAQRGMAVKKGKRSTVMFDELNQGMIHPTVVPEALLPDGEAFTTYPTVVHQAKNNMQRLPHCVLLTKVGGFYELYFHQATEYGPLLNLKVAVKKTNAGPVAMAGFPASQIDKFLKILVQDLGKHVALSEETPRDPVQKIRSGSPLFDRQVKRVITPGTLIDEHFLSPYENNFLLAISTQQTGLEPKSPVLDKELLQDDITLGIAWLDLSSGDFFTQSIELSKLSTVLARIRAREVILDLDSQTAIGRRVCTMLASVGQVATQVPHLEDSLTSDSWLKAFDQPARAPTIEQFSKFELLAMSLVLRYVHTQIPDSDLHLRPPTRKQMNEYMSIDRNSLRNLEVLKTLRDGYYKGSLLHAIRRTSTESGARLLAYRLTSPSLSSEVIEERLNLIETFMADPVLLEEVTDLLQQAADTSRLVQKFCLGRGNGDDLLSLAGTIEVTGHVVKAINTSVAGKSSSMQGLLTHFEGPEAEKVSADIRQAIDQEGLMLLHRSDEAEAADTAALARCAITEASDVEDLGKLAKRLQQKQFQRPCGTDEDAQVEEDIWIMRKDANEVISELHTKLEQLCDNRTKLAAQLQKQLEVRSLSLRFTPGLGHHCHVRGRDTKLDVSKIPEAKTVGSSKSTKSFYHTAWSRLGASIDNAKLRIRSEEQLIFRRLRNEVIRNIVLLRRNATIVDEIDVACSFARLANEHNLVRPILTHASSHKIIAGRHMMVEGGLITSGGAFTPNDCVMDEKRHIWLVTGPNMAGKSTFLRQTALLSILAQTGSFVPAEYAEIGLVDQIFSRMGSADNLAQDQSTFMVEMLETAHILGDATSRSFVIMDEVGRGTTPEDGVAVAYAVLDHLHEHVRCRTLFATHFHALADMTKDFGGLACFCTDLVEEPDGAFRYDHRLRPGVNRDSHALKVARLAGMPENVLRIAREVMNQRHG